MSGSVDASRFRIPTLKDDPADAEAISHKLLVRGGFVRQLGAGLYTYLPLGWRVIQHTMGIIREEMDTIGVEMLMPVLQPAELWQATGRLGVDNLFHLKDSSGKPYVLAMTHEECITWHAAREIRSYRELPQIWYHQQTKERDEPRPRGGILRTREFIMKDSYSFDRDLAGLEESYARHRDVYVRIFERCGLETFAIEADVGMMGGHGGEEFVAPSPNGEADLVRCSNCDYAANVEVARSTPRPAEFPAAPGRSAGGCDARRDDHRGAGRAARDRPGGDGQGDAHRRRRRDGARACARRPAPARSQDREGARDGVPARRGGRDPGGVRRRSGLDRAGRRRRDGDRRRVAARGPVRDAVPTAPAGTCAGSRPGATIRPSSTTCARSPKAIPARSAAPASCTSSRPSRWGTSSSSARATPCR